MTKKVRVPRDECIFDHEGFKMRSAAVCVKDETESEVSLPWVQFRERVDFELKKCPSVEESYYYKKCHSTSSKNIRANLQRKVVP